MTDIQQYFRSEIPRHPSWGGPLVLPPGAVYEPGPHVCKRCKRSNKARQCKCVYYKRTTTWIDVLQSEFALKAWDRRQVAYGMSQRPDLVLAAAACRNDSAVKSDKDKLQEIADAAKEHAMASAGANIGTALHTMTEWIDTGQPLGVVPEPYPADLKAYEQATTDIDWVNIESFRVYDKFRVAGTADRVGWYRGRLCIFDLKTSPNDNAISYPHGPAMQLAMYAHSTPYDIDTDARVSDPAPVNLDRAYIIALPAGKGHCEIRPVDIGKGWAACELAVQVWEWRSSNDLIVDDDADVSWQPNHADTELISRAKDAPTLAALRELWIFARNNGLLTPIFRVEAEKRGQQLAATTQKKVS